jgi:uncharacterized protein YndB with AHSA1/START domain
MSTGQNAISPNEDMIVVEIEIAAPPERVFRALTDPRQLLLWWTGCNHWELELRTGAKWRATGSDEQCGDWETEGEVVDVNSPWSLTYTWGEQVEYRGSVSATTVRYDLEPYGKGTRVRVTHYGFGGNREAFESYRGGWPGVLELLRAHTEAI